MDVFKKRSDKKLGLVFAGGGAKGAYQIGVWTFLRETGLEHCVLAAGGTSVGALNAVLFASGNLDSAREIWLTKIEDAVLSQERKVREERKRRGRENLSMLFQKPLDSIKNLFSEAMEVAGEGIYNRKGLLSVIAENLDLDFIKTSPMNLYANCTCVSTAGKTIFRLNDYAKDDILKILLASSAIPGIFPPQSIGGRDFYDGGLSDNCPVSALYDEDCEEILAVHLKERSDEKITLKNGRHLTEIFPSKSLGNFFSGTLDFSPVHVKECMDLGYTDCAENKNGIRDALMDLKSRLTQKSPTRNFFLDHPEILP